jgi:hypothetical protein
MQANKTAGKGGMVRPVLHLALLLALGCLIPAQADTAGQGSAGDSTVRQGQRHYKKHSLEERVRKLTQWLALDATQQSELRKVLEDQREQIRKVWDDASVPAAYRISATQAISDKTADQIRALLNEEQRKKFNPPRQPREAAGSVKPSVEDWMDAAKPK